MAEEQEQEDNYNSFPYESFIEDQIFIDYENEEYEERVSEITTEMAERGTEITETETETSSIRSKELLRQARVWKHFEKKTIEKDDEQTETYILCHICEGHFSANNSTTTLERHLKAKHFDVYKDLGQVESNAKPWTVDIQQEKHNLFVNWIITDQQPFTIVENQTLNTSIVPNCVKKLRIFISTVRNSPKQMDKLKEFFQVEKIKFKVPLLDCTTRWNYTFYMIDRALEIKPLLAHLVSNLTSLSNNWPNEEEWNILTILANLLAPFASVTRVISASSYPTIGEVKLLFEGIRMHLNQSRGENFILQDQVDEMNHVFTNYFDEISEALHVPAFFDSRYKKLAYGEDPRKCL
ncbi:unnamed protein product [Rhizophagus irregularis]|nr:unnamed protein product [Rhizophagus irregularis]